MTTEDERHEAAYMEAVRSVAVKITYGGSGGKNLSMTKPEHIKDFYHNNELIHLTKELTEMLRKNRTIDWQKKETARAQMRKMDKRLLKKYNYPPEDYDFAISTVISQCELWTDHEGIPAVEAKNSRYAFSNNSVEWSMVAEEQGKY